MSNVTPVKWNLTNSVGDSSLTQLRFCYALRASVVLYMLSLRSSTSPLTLQFMNSAITMLPLCSWHFICILPAHIALSWKLNYANVDCCCATADYLLALKKFHNSILMFYSKCHPSNFIPRTSQETTFTQS